MKKICLFVFSILLLVPISVFALDPEVLELNANSYGLDIAYNGEMSEGSHAVMCKLYDSNEEEVGLLSSAVYDGLFTGIIGAPSDGEYVLACANYEGGEFQKVNVTVDSYNPDTYDAGIKTSIILLITSMIGIMGISFIVLSKKYKKN